MEGDHIVVTCPVRFRQRWLVADQAASFFFGPDCAWTSLVEVRLPERSGQSAGNIDFVLVSYDQYGRILDFGALEVQAVYISGNVRRPFERYMQDPAGQCQMDWSGEANYPRPDYLSSSRKRLAPQLLYKGGILHAWRKRMAVAVDSAFFATLPVLPSCSPEEADIVWLIYDLILDSARNVYDLTHSRSIYTRFDAALENITRAEPGPVETFIEMLQQRIDEKLNSSAAPDAPTLADVVGGGED